MRIFILYRFAKILDKANNIRLLSVVNVDFLRILHKKMFILFCKFTFTRLFFFTLLSFIHNFYKKKHNQFDLLL